MEHNANSPNMRGHYAGFITRLIAFVIDLLIVTTISAITISILSNILSFFNMEGLLSSSRIDISELANLARVALLTALAVGQFLFVIGYYVLFWMAIGQTPGKLLMGIRVLRKDGHRLSFWGALRRYIGYWISALPLFLGYIWVLADDRRQGWHDKIGGSYVVYAWDAHENEFLFPRFRKQVKKLKPGD